MRPALRLPLRLALPALLTWPAAGCRSTCPAVPAPANRPAPAAAADDQHTLTFPDADGEDAYTLICAAPGAADDQEPLLRCDEPVCELTYRATRVERTPGGFQVVARDVPVERTLDFATAGGGWKVTERDGGLHAEIADADGPVLLVDALLTGGGASEATVAREYLGVVATPSAEIRLVDGVHRAGRASQPGDVVDELRTGARCELRIDLFE